MKMKPEIGVQRKLVKRAKWILLGLGVLFVGLGMFLDASLIIITGVLFILLGVYLFSVIIVQEPERWIIERFGEFHRVVKPGWRHKIPFVETVRAKPRVWKQPISLFVDESTGEEIPVQLVDGPVIPQNPVVYERVNPEHPEYPIYRVSNWVLWVRDVVEAVVLRYLHTLRIAEAIDEGMGQGEIFNRINQAPQITRSKQRKVRAKIRMLKKEIENFPNKKDILQPIIDELEEEAGRLLKSARVHAEVVEDLKRILAEAEEKGLEILSVYIDGFALPEEVKQARQKPLIAKREAEAALYEAIREATKRADPILNTARKLQEGGLSEEEAMKQALELEVMETLAEKGSWTAGLPQVIQQVTPLMKTLLELLLLSKGKGRS